MEFFSTRNKILSINPNGLRSTSIQLRERIWNVFYKEGIIELVYIVLQSVVKPGITGFFKIDLHIKCYIYLS